MMHTAFFALGRLPVGEMNATESRYAAHLDLLQRAGDVFAFRFEAIKFRLADNTFYTPDFLVMRGDRTIELHEVKGHWTDDGKVKIKVAASLYPFFKFIAVFAKPKRDGGGWREENY